MGDRIPWLPHLRIVENPRLTPEEWEMFRRIEREEGEACFPCAMHTIAQLSADDASQEPHLLSEDDVDEVPPQDPPDR